MCKCRPENFSAMFCGEAGCDIREVPPENTYACVQNGCRNYGQPGGGKHTYCDFHKPKPELATVGVPDFRPPTKRYTGRLSRLTQEEIDEFLGNKVGNIDSWFCSDWIKQVAMRMLGEIIERRASDTISEVSKK